MYTDYEVLVKRSDLLPVTFNEFGYTVEGSQGHETVTEEQMWRRGLEAISVAIKLRDLAAEKAAKEAKEWELEHAVPLARKMHDAFHKYSDKWRDSTDEDLWLRNYRDGNHLVLKWVATASAALKTQEGTNVE